MKENYKTNIIDIALIYNYLANKEEKLSVLDIQKYISDINEKLRKWGKDEIDIYDIEENPISYEYVYEGLNEFVKLKKDDFHLACLYYYNQRILPDYLITASLQEKALSNLGIKREDLPIISSLKWQYETKGIYSCSANDAMNIARKHLETAEKKNIRIGGASPTRLEGDYGYNVYVSYQEVIEKLDVNALDKSLYCARNNIENIDMTYNDNMKDNNQNNYEKHYQKIKR